MTFALIILAWFGIAALVLTFALCRISADADAAFERLAPVQRGTSPAASATARVTGIRPRLDGPGGRDSGCETLEDAQREVEVAVSGGAAS